MEALTCRNRYFSAFVMCCRRSDHRAQAGVEIATETKKGGLSTSFSVQAIDVSMYSVTISEDILHSRYERFN